uniref:ATP-binding cassette sub-family A member 8-A n=1 Tax=Ganoderma boninense TaxID=34458 RepID=A0A5K1K805_9APHY|nr:ATP-binding cassette sub-family A member 8-A [Ganoderma boninense]
MLRKQIALGFLLSNRGPEMGIRTAMANLKVYYGPLEDQHDIDLERLLLAGDFITGVGYAQARSVQLMYVENRRYPGGPWQYFLDTQNEAVNVVWFVSLCVVISMCDLLVTQLWRCWVIWTALDHHLGYLIVSFPAVMLLASLVTLRPGPPPFGVAYFSLSLGVNVVLTTLIVGRLLAFRRANVAFLPPSHAERYLSLAAVIVESAALYSLFAVAFLVTYGLNQPINQVLLAFAQAAQQVATYLIIYRVADGTAWSKNTMNKHTMSSVNFCGGATIQVRVPTPRLDSSISVEVEVVSIVDAECGAPQER